MDKLTTISLEVDGKEYSFDRSKFDQDSDIQLLFGMVDKLNQELTEAEYVKLRATHAKRSVCLNLQHLIKSRVKSGLD